MNVIHPCTAFAQAAGFPTWQAAVAAMRAGTVLTGYTSVIQRTGCKSMLGMLVFTDRLKEERLDMLMVNEGQAVMVGLTGLLPPDLVQERDRVLKAFMAEYGKPKLSEDDREHIRLGGIHPDQR